MSDHIVEEYFVEVIKDPDTNRVRAECWYKEKGGDMHREGEPANHWFDIETGKTDYVEYMLDNELSRPDGKPAVIHYENGKPTRTEFWVAGKLHRYGGPAVIEQDPVTGEATHREYHIHGEEQNPPEETLESTP